MAGTADGVPEHTQHSAVVPLANGALLAGVLTAVVSYVLNNVPGNVSDKTRMRVWAAIVTLNYPSNSIATALVGGRTNDRDGA